MKLLLTDLVKILKNSEWQPNDGSAQARLVGRAANDLSLVNILSIFYSENGYYYATSHLIGRFIAQHNPELARTYYPTLAEATQTGDVMCQNTLIMVEMGLIVDDIEWF